MLAQYKAIAAVAGVVVVFFAGWTVNGWRWESKIADAEREHHMAVREAEAKVRAEWAAQAQIDELLMSDMTDDLTILRGINQNLNRELANAELVKPVTVVEERIVEIAGTCEVAVARNPFTAEFARLFNESASRNSGGLPATDTEG